MSHSYESFFKAILLALPLSIGFCLAFASEPAHGADLSAEQKELARQADAFLKHVETNLKLAQDSAGPGNGPIAATKARLVLIRLQPAKDNLPAALEKLKPLPADHADVITLQKRADAASVGVAALQARLDGKTATPANPGTATTPTTKLDFRQEESLKNARFILREIEGQAAAVEKVVTDIKPVEDRTKIDHRIVAQAMNSIAFCRQRNGFMANHMEKVPADGTGVAPVAEAWKKAMAGIDANEKVLAPIHKELSDLINPQNHPQFEADVKRLSELAGQYGYIERFAANRADSASLVQQFPAAVEERNRVSKAYALLVYQKTDQGERLAKMVGYFNEKLKAFADAAESQKKTLPQEIREHITEINRLADQAVRESKPAFFTGGIQQVLDFAAEKQTLFAVLSPEESKTTASEIEKTRADLKVKQKSLFAAIVAANGLPPDRYTGTDRAKLIELATANWKEQQPDAVILMARIPSEQWSRSTMWRYSNKTWYFIDASSLQVQLIVKHEGDLAVIRPINLSMNHASGDKLSAGAMDDVKDELIPQRLLPVAKVK